jgi:threonine aldolase
LVSKLKDHEILGYAISPNRVRLVVHLDISKEMVEKTVATFKAL